MKIKLNGIEFEVAAVPGALRTALMADPMMEPALRRDIYAWDRAAGTGRTLVPTGPNGAVPLPNGIAFFVPRAGKEGITVKNDAASKKMGERFLATVNAKSVGDVIRSLANLVQQPQKEIPLKEFAVLNEGMSYVIRSHVDFAVVQLRDASRNLTAFLFVPALVRFLPAIDRASVQGDPPAQVPAPAFVVPVRSEANQTIRRLAAGTRLQEMQAEFTALPGGVEEASPERRLEFARVVAEWKALAKPLPGQSRTPPRTIPAARATH